jgi:cytoskeletal protein CcmA (bactofilin family)
MFNRRKNVKPHEIASLIGATTTIEGDIVFSGGLRIDGTVRGGVRCVDGEQGGMLVISESGSVTGAVSAGHLVVAGNIAGDVAAAQLIELRGKARIQGDVRYRALEMHHGAVVVGRLVHISQAPESATPVQAAAGTNAPVSGPEYAPIMGETRSSGDAS